VGESHHLSEDTSHGERPLPDGSADLSAPDGVPARAPSDSAPLAGEHAHAGGASHRDADLETTLLRVVACCECLYPLRGLARDGLCPECGTPIADTLRPRRRREPLRLTPVRVLRRMSRGLNLAWWGAATCASGCLAALAVASGPAPHWLQSVHDAIFVTLIGLAWLVAQSGLFILSKPEPFNDKNHSYTGELLHCSAAVLFIGAIPVFMILVFRTQGPLSGLRSLGCFAPVGLLTLGAALILQSLVLPAYVEALAQRISDPVLAKQARRRKYLGPLLAMTTAMLGGVPVILMFIITIGDRLRRRLNAIIAVESQPSADQPHINSASTISNVSSPPGSRT